jgi:hypothetical protein
MNFSKAGKIFLAINGVFIAALADPNVGAIISAHPKAAAVIAVVSNLAHLVADAFKKQG